MKKVLTMVFLGCLLLSGCGQKAAPADPDRLQIVTTVFPAYDFARAAAGDRAEVTLLLPPGAESHSYEPTPADILAVRDCDLFIYLGGESDAWVDTILEAVEPTGTVMKMVDCVELLEACKASLERLYTCRDTLDRAIANAPAGAADPDSLALFDQRKQAFITAMDDDLNTADGVAVLFDLVRDLNTRSNDAATTKDTLTAGAALFDELTGVLGLLYNRKQGNEIPAQVQALVEARAAARKAKNFAEADRLRDEIAALGYAVKETRQGVEITKL